MNKEWSRLGPIAWIVLGVATIVILLVVTIFVTGRKDATNLENGLVQVIAFALSVLIAIGVGFVSARSQAKEIVRPHGRKAVRRIVTLGSGIQAFGATIETERERMARQAEETGQVNSFEVEATFRVLSSQVAGQLRVVEDAIADWGDVVPEDVEAIQKGGDVQDGG